MADPPPPEAPTPQTTAVPPPDAATWTAVAALWARATEQSTDQPLLEDPLAKTWLEALSLDTSRFEGAAATPIAVCARARLTDHWITQWARDSSPNPGVVVELGIGFSTRPARLSALGLDFIGIDRTNTARQRLRLPNIDSAPLQIADLTEPGWVDELQQNLASRKPCFVAEGLLMYLEPAKVENLFARLAEAFPDAMLLFDAYAKPALTLQRFHDCLSQLNTPLRSVFKPSPHLRILESHTLRDWPDAYARLPLLYRLPGVHRLHATHRATLTPPGSAQ